MMLCTAYIQNNNKKKLLLKPQKIIQVSLIRNDVEIQKTFQNKNNCALSVLRSSFQIVPGYWQCKSWECCAVHKTWRQVAFSVLNFCSVCTNSKGMINIYMNKHEYCIMNYCQFVVLAKLYCPQRVDFW